MRLTNKQVMILTVLADRNPDGTEVDLDQLLEALTEKYKWETTKASMQFSIRALVSEGMVRKLPREKRRGRQHCILGITDPGRRVLGR